MLTEHTIEINNRKVYYWERNPSAKQTIIFLHGFKGSHAALVDMSAHFINCRTILIDLPGYGKSESMVKSHTIKNYAAFLDQFITRLEIKDFELVGYSYGGSIATVYAGIYTKQLRHLVLISPAIPFQSISNALAATQLKIGSRLPHRLQRLWFINPVIETLSAHLLIKSVSRKRKAEMMRMGMQAAQQQRIQASQQSLQSFIATPFYFYAKKITAPTFILAGEDDIIAPLETQIRLSRHINQVRIDLIPEIGHLAPMERPRTIARLIGEFIGHTIAPHQYHLHLGEDAEIKRQPKRFAQTKYY